MLSGLHRARPAHGGRALGNRLPVAPNGVYLALLGLCLAGSAARLRPGRDRPRFNQIAPDRSRLLRVLRLSSPVGSLASAPPCWPFPARHSRRRQAPAACGGISGRVTGHFSADTEGTACGLRFCQVRSALIASGNRFPLKVSPNFPRNLPVPPVPVPSHNFHAGRRADCPCGDIASRPLGMGTLAAGRVSAEKCFLRGGV